MQANNIFYYPYYPYYDIASYTTLFSYFNSITNYSSSQQQCQISATQPVKRIVDVIKQTQIPDIVPTPITKARTIPKSTKYSTGTFKLNKEKVQLFSDDNNKNQQRQLNEQKEGRNANSNLLRMFFRRLQNKIQNKPYQIQQVISKYKMKITLNQFIQWIKINKIDHRNYIRVPSVKKLFVDQRFVRQHTKIMRILFKNFIDSESISCYLTSKKVRKQVMAHNYKTIRNIFNQILNIKQKI